MNKISLRWRITFLMGILVLLSTILLTTLSIHNMTNRFFIPLTIPYVDIQPPSLNSGGNALSIPPESNPGDLPEGVFYAPEIRQYAENARQTFSFSSYAYMALVILGGMIAAYCLAGRAMGPISRLNDEIESIDGGNLSKRVSIPQTKDELENLSLSFNKLLAQLEQEFEKEKRFSANAAHELKTPLATIITSAQVLQINDQTSLEEYQENLDITLQSARRLSKVVDGLLMLNRTDWDASFETVSFTQIVLDIQKELEPLYGEKHILLQTDLQANILKGNALLLYRAFFNLLENAYKYTGSNGRITVTSCHLEQETVIRISDTGIGIGENDIHSIFEPFYRADKSRSRKIAGAGLGLSIAKEIFDLHKASISIHSEKDHGFTAEVHFPTGHSLLEPASFPSQTGKQPPAQS